MKKVLFFLIALLTMTTVFAQSDRYNKAMETLVATLDTTQGRDDLNTLANSFERIANAEKTQWLPFYYAAYCHIRVGYTYIGPSGNPDNIQAEADFSEKLIQRAEALSANNAEIFCLKNMHSGLLIMTNPALNGMKYGPQAEEFLKTAKKLSPDNPRVYLLEGQSAMYKPAEWGGGPEVAKGLLQTALQKFRSFIPESNLHPNWGETWVVELLKK